MESDEESRSSSNSTGSSASSNNGPASPQPENNESNDQAQQPIAVTEDTKDSEKKEDEEEIELSDVEDESSKQQKADISHEDLSDISDLESNSPTNNFTDLRQKLEKQRMNGSGKSAEKVHDEDELDFEADEENPKKVVSENKAKDDKSDKEDGEQNSDDGAAPESGEELEDGEVTDGDEKRPEESEPKAVCRFYTRGQCTWGMSCRFLHPGTTDKGNYTMFDMIRPVPVQNAPMPVYDYRNERPNHFIPPHAAPHFAGGRVPPAALADSESSWERGLRAAKEMMKKATKRKEQDIDFEEKKMNLSGPPDEIERDPYYARASPDISPVERVPRERRVGYPDYSPPPKYQRTAAHYEEDAFGRAPRYRELPAHRMPHYEDDEDTKRRVRTNREVIVEKADEWTDPWERKRRGGSGGRDRAGRGRERSYSNSSSYSSSSSSRSSRSSSESSGSPARRKRFEPQRAGGPVRKPMRGRSRSTSLKRRLSPPQRTRTVERRVASPSPTFKRKKPISPPPARNERARSSKKRRESSSTSGSGSGSDSESSDSSSTSSSKGKKRREKIVSERKPVHKAPEPKKSRLTPPREDKKDKGKESAAAKLKSTRREELLKQLKAVEEAIARKKSKI